MKNCQTKKKQDVQSKLFLYTLKKMIFENTY